MVKLTRWHNGSNLNAAIRINLGDAARSPPRAGGWGRRSPPPFANGSNTSRNINVFIVIVVAEEEVVVVVEEEGIVIRTWVEPGLNLGSNLLLLLVL